VAETTRRIEVIAQFDQMWCYLWEEKDKPNECKFGERWVFAGQDPLVEVWKRIKESLGVRKDLIADGSITLVAYWNVSDYAKQVGKYYQRSRMDDFIREQVGYRKGNTGEMHTIPAIQFQLAVNAILVKVGQPLPVAGLSTYQYRVAQEVIAAFENGHTVVLAELCARYGKTLWAGALACEQDAPLTIVASYVKTVFPSFAKDWTSFDQFKKYAHVDTQSPDYQTTIRNALKNGQPIIAYLSMCKGTRREERINFLFGLKTDRLVIVDEADFGVHRDGQSKPLIAAVGSADRVVLMTGTNADRAVSDWRVDYPVSVTYPELLVQKATQADLSNGLAPLQHFAIDTHRDTLFPDLRCYQMDLTGPVERAFKLGLIDEDFRNAPSWSKFAADPIKAKGFWTSMLQAVFLGQHNMNQLNVDLQLRDRSKKKVVPKVAMLFLPAGMETPNLEDAVNAASEALPAFKVLPLSGGVRINGKKMTNAKVEGVVKQEIAKAKKDGQSVLLISSIIAQRSFSIPEITELYLAYDQGEAGATIQKMSRVLTPGGTDKVGNVISLSFDPNRDDKFDSMVIETSLNTQSRRNAGSMVESIREVLGTIDIFSCQENGAVKITVDQYLDQIVARNSLSRVIGKASNVFLLSSDEITALASGKHDYLRQQKVVATPMGKTGKKVGPTATMGPGKSKPDNASLREIAKAREVIATIVENMDVIILGSGCSTLDDALSTVAKDEEMQACVAEEFGVPFDVVQLMFDRGVIKQEWIEVMYDDR
jgi:hypothetical protein